MALREGKNREIRRVCEQLGWTVNRLIRVSYGPFHLGALPAGAVEEVPAKVLREQAGDRWAPANPTAKRAAKPSAKSSGAPGNARRRRKT